MDKNLFMGSKKPKPIPLMDIRHILKKEIDCIKGYKKYKKLPKLKAFIISTQTFKPDKFRTILSLQKEIERYNDKNCVLNLSKMKRPELILEAQKRNLDIGESIRGKAPRKTAGNVFKPLEDMTGIKKYATDDEQLQIEKNLEEITDPYDVDIKQTDNSGNLTGKTVKLNLRTKQTQFIDKMVYSNNRGGIAFWGVGTGKTVLTVITIRAYLHYYKKGKVVFIAPSGLLSNLIKTLFLFGLDIRDKRIQYFSFEKYVKTGTDCKNALLVIDEAHNLRTHIDLTSKSEEALKMLREKGAVNDLDKVRAKKGGRVWAILKKCSLIINGDPIS